MKKTNDELHKTTVMEEGPAIKNTHISGAHNKISEWTRGLGKAL